MILKEVKYYCEAAGILGEQRKENTLFPPILMNATFSCELFEFWRQWYEICDYSTHYSFVLDYIRTLDKISNEIQI